jgi:transposase InsO family protein
VVGLAIFKKRPTSSQVTSFLGKAMRRAGVSPRHIITDKGREFFCEWFKAWCGRHGIRPRFGAVGQHGSIALVERFIRSMKSECTRRIMVPMRLDSMRQELAFYASWFNEHRPHAGLDGRTPQRWCTDPPELRSACSGTLAASTRCQPEATHEV